MGTQARPLPPDDGLRLVGPGPEIAAAFWDLVRDFRMTHEGHQLHTPLDLDEAGIPTYMERVQAEARGEGLPEGYVPQSTSWLQRPDGVLVGVSFLRHRLTPALEDIGGHIGYAIAPSARRRGYGTRILALTLPPARALGLDRVLVTCDADNLGSARIIERNGGILASRTLSPQTRTLVSRYWIALS